MSRAAAGEVFPEFCRRRGCLQRKNTYFSCTLNRVDTARPLRARAEKECR
jgi:hypothetical protein